MCSSLIPLWCSQVFCNTLQEHSHLQYSSATRMIVVHICFEVHRIIHIKHDCTYWTFGSLCTWHIALLRRLQTLVCLHSWKILRETAVKILASKCTICGYGRIAIYSSSMQYYPESKMVHFCNKSLKYLSKLFEIHMRGCNSLHISDVQRKGLLGAYHTFCAY